MKLDSTEKKIIAFGCLLGGIFLACLCAILIFGISVFFIQNTVDGNLTLNDLDPTPTPQLYRDDQTLDPNQQLPAPTEGEYYDTLTILENEVIPERNPIEVAGKYLDIDNVPETILDADGPYEVGDSKTFWISNTDTNNTFQKNTKLEYITDHAYFWIATDVVFDKDELKVLAETFENQMYPTNRSFFGSEWNPGIDNDERIYIVYTKGIGVTTAGYFSTADSLHPLVHEYSNGHEMFIFNADNSPLSDPYTFGVLAHEFQHMIHWNQDINEEGWINEGFSEVSVLLNGYKTGGFDYSYINSPDYQLNTWPNGGNTGKSYGASFLYLTYFLDRMGENITKELVANQTNGLQSIDEVLENNNILNSITENFMTADDIAIDWAVTNFINDEKVDEGQYFYHNYDDAITASPTDSIRSCNPSTTRMDIHQYGVDYIRITCNEEVTLNFLGSTFTNLLPEGAYSGEYRYWSNNGDESDMTLTKKFDFSENNGPLTLQYYTWFDIEEDFDYVYLSTSTDGETWDILTTPSGTDYNPTGNNLGWGYSTNSGGWILEMIDLSAYSGEEVYVRFEYITDGAVNGEGILIDDISIPEISYFTDFEEDDGGWVGEGFVRVNNQLPQTFKLAIIHFDSDISVEYLPLPEDNKISVLLNLDDEDNDIVLVVVGTTRYTRQLATYEISIVP